MNKGTSKDYTTGRFVTVALWVNELATDAVGAHREGGTHPVDVTAVSSDDMTWLVVNSVQWHGQSRFKKVKHRMKILPSGGTTFAVSAEHPKEGVSPRPEGTEASEAKPRGKRKPGMGSCSGSFSWSIILGCVGRIKSS